MVVKTSHSGLRDWLIQRISAIVIGLYLIFIGAYLQTINQFILPNGVIYLPQYLWKITTLLADYFYGMPGSGYGRC